MSAINLTKDLEALYYFDEQNFDSQRNLLRDHSGYGRHATASGGPTVGVEGPNDFGATGFDGSDDQFVADSGLGGNKYEVSISWVRNIPENDIQNNDLGFFENGLVLNYRNVGSNVVLESTAQDGNDDIKLNPDWFSAPEPYTGWQSEHFVFGNGVWKWYVGNTLWQTRGMSGPLYDSSIINIGNKSPEYFSGDIAFFGSWSRALADAEIAQLNRLTAPRRAQL